MPVRWTLQLAANQDFSGCVVEYDFDADGAVEVKNDKCRTRSDETLPEGYDVADETVGKVNLAWEEAMRPDLGDGTRASVSRPIPRRLRRNHRRRLASILFRR